MQEVAKLISVTVRITREGHWVDWSNGLEQGSLGPYQNAEMAEDVRSAKEREFTDNQGYIDDA